MLSKDKYIELSGVSLSYGNKRVLSDVNLTLDRGDFMVVTGANGGGKTSLIRIMLGLQRTTTGVVNYYDKDKDIHKRVGYLPQKNTLDMSFPILIRELVASGLINMGGKKMPASVLSSKVDAMLRMMELEDLANRQIGEVSGGQFQRALFARAIISEPTLLVLDEPMSYLDKTFGEKLSKILDELSKKSTIVVVSHHLELLKNIATRCIMVQQTVEESHILR